MSRSTRQEALIRSLIEALCLTLKAKLVGQPRQKPKVEAADGVLYLIERLAKDHPITLLPREAGKVIRVLNWFQDVQKADSELQTSEALTAMAMGLADLLVQVFTPSKKLTLLIDLNKSLQALYDTFDRQGKKMDLLIRGAAVCDQLLSKEI